MGDKLANILVLSATPKPFSEDHGGKQRLVKLTKALAKTHTVTLLSLSWEGEDFTKQITNTLRHISVPVEDSVIKAKRSKNTNLINPNNDILIAVYKKYLKSYIAKMNTIAATSNIIVVDHYATAPIIDFLKHENVPVLYSSQNCETDLATQLYGEGSEDVEITRQIEETIIKKSKGIAYCSNDDFALMQDNFTINVPSFYIPNGTDIPENVTPGQNVLSEYILFVGSGHPPNVVASKKIIKIAKLVPDYEFIIAGSCANRLEGKLPKNVTLIPKVSNKEVDDLFANAFAFINPMESGSGTHLKMMKALSYGLPIISSDVGARGFSAKERKDCMIIAETEQQMSDAVETIKQQKTYNKMSKNSILLSKEYDWEKIGEDFTNAIESVLNKKMPKIVQTNKKRKKILIYSIIRNRANFIGKYHSQLYKFVKTNPQYEFYLSIYENDSDDGTKEQLYTKDWSFFSGVSILSENINTEYFTSVKDGDRVKNLSEARNRAIEAGGFLDKVDYVLMVEGDVRWDTTAAKKLLEFDELEPNFDIVSSISLRKNGTHYDWWATRKSAVYVEDHSEIDENWQNKKYGKYYSTSNGLCLYRAKPFQEGIRHGWINNVTKEFDCEMVVLCQNFQDRGYKNIYILYDSITHHA